VEGGAIVAAERGPREEAGREGGREGEVLMEGLRRAKLPRKPAHREVLATPEER
jgi:hypothetical protein